MKKLIIFIVLIISNINYAQTNGIGINTEDPQETLDIKGTIRVTDLPENSVGKIYDGNFDKNTIFNGTRNVIADDQGNLGYGEFSTNHNNTTLNSRVFYTRYVKAKGDEISVINNDGTLLIDVSDNKNATIDLPKAINNKHRILTICAIANGFNTGEIIIKGIAETQTQGGSTTIISSNNEYRCKTFQSGAASTDQSLFEWFTISNF